MGDTKALQATIAQMTARGKGILAADESASTIAKRLQSIHTASTEDNRRAYRDVLLTTPGLNQYVCGVILFEETLAQSALNGTPFAALLDAQGIVPGIKVDKGLVPLNHESSEMVTQGTDGLADRLSEYKKQGARFAKWRAVYSVGDHLPSKAVNAWNALNLARYAALCQDQGIVPIVEPEILMDGDHTIEQCEKASTKVFRKVFSALVKQNVKLEYMILKPSMMIAGKNCKKKSDVTEVAEATIRVLKRTVPAAVPTINFLSGGQTPEQATQHLQAMNAMGNLPWHVSFSYGRALQEPPLVTWAGKADNKAAAQAALLKRAKLNYLATRAEYRENMEKETIVV
ncbi:MAG TPA: class I fructose-bisphosphate aldolase [Coxiellaceae bacterium]|nr:class I fructose-bisphosphate aldolase [Coxiellaceae bacterium]